MIEFVCSKTGITASMGNRFFCVVMLVVAVVVDAACFKDGTAVRVEVLNLTFDKEGEEDIIGLQRVVKVDEVSHMESFCVIVML